MRTSSLCLFLLLSTACGDVPSAPPEGPESVARALSCSVPGVPVGSGPSTSAPWRFVQLASSYSKALCNDGTSPTYMIRRNAQTTKWLIWLDGGGSCIDGPSCAARWEAGGLTNMSSKAYVKQAAEGTLEFPSRGVLSVDPVENPTFHDANLVYIPYCSSDAWSGDRQGNLSLPVASVERWHFRGREILKGVLRELMLRENLQAATDIVYGGGSAGGVGVYLTVDDVGASMPAGARYLALPDAGFRFDHPSYDPATGLESTARPTQSWNDMVTAAGNWGGRGDASCDAAATTPEEHTHCREPGYLATHGHIQTPLLIIQSQYDRSPLSALGVELVNGVPANPSEAAYVKRYAARTRELLTQANAWHSCFDGYTSKHTTAASGMTGTLSINGILMRDAIDAWFRRPCESFRLIEAPTPGTP